MSFIRISPYRVINKNSIISVGHYSNAIFNSRCYVEIKWALMNTNGGFVMFSSMPYTEKFYEDTEPEGYHALLQIIMESDNTNANPMGQVGLFA